MEFDWTASKHAYLGHLVARTGDLLTTAGGGLLPIGRSIPWDAVGPPCNSRIWLPQGAVGAVAKERTVAEELVEAVWALAVCRGDSGRSA